MKCSFTQVYVYSKREHLRGKWLSQQGLSRFLGVYAVNAE
jgi:hypothetical protein